MINHYFNLKTQNELTIVKQKHVSERSLNNYLFLIFKSGSQQTDMYSLFNLRIFSTYQIRIKLKLNTFVLFPAT